MSARRGKSSTRVEKKRRVDDNEQRDRPRLNLLLDQPSVLQLETLSFLPLTDVAGLGLVSKPLLALRERFFENLQRYVLDVDDLDSHKARALTCALRYSTRLSHLHLQFTEPLRQFHLYPPQLRALRLLFPALSKSKDEPLLYLIKRNKDTLREAPTFVPRAALPLLARCPLLTTVPSEWSWEGDSSVALRRGISAIVKKCPRVDRLGLCEEALDEDDAKPLLLVRPLRSLTLVQYYGELLKFAATCPTLRQLSELELFSRRRRLHRSFLDDAEPLLRWCAGSLTRLNLTHPEALPQSTWEWNEYCFSSDEESEEARERKRALPPLLFELPQLRELTYLANAPVQCVAPKLQSLVVDAEGLVAMLTLGGAEAHDATVNAFPQLARLRVDGQLYPLLLSPAVLVERWGASLRELRVDWERKSLADAARYLSLALRALDVLVIDEFRDRDEHRPWFDRYPTPEAQAARAELRRQAWAQGSDARSNLARFESNGAQSGRLFGVIEAGVPFPRLLEARFDMGRNAASAPDEGLLARAPVLRKLTLDSVECCSALDQVDWALLASSRHAQLECICVRDEGLYGHEVAKLAAALADARLFEQLPRLRQVSVGGRETRVFGYDRRAKRVIPPPSERCRCWKCGRAANAAPEGKASDSTAAGLSAAAASGAGGREQRASTQIASKASVALAAQRNSSAGSKRRG